VGRGYRDNASTPISMLWNGTAWISLGVPPVPTDIAADFPYAELSDISCVSSSYCMAVGQYASGSSSGQDLPFSDLWNGSNWSTSSMVPPDGSTNTSPLGVSCVSMTMCISVGSQTGSAALAEMWNGTRWVLQKTPAAPPGSNYDVSAVSCVSPSWCDAVGNLFSTGETYELAPTAMYFDGVGWHAQATAPGSTASSGLTDVSCTSPSFCLAVGSDSDIPLAERWDGNSWSSVSFATPIVYSESQLDSVSCASPTACVAAGEHEYSLAEVLVENWDGSNLSEEQSTPMDPNPDSEGWELSGVSCAGALVCMAVGSQADGTTTLSMLR
jgi:hypothetical protein